MQTSKHLVFSAFLAIALCLMGAGQAQDSAKVIRPLPALDLGDVIERDQMIPMRDGKHLSALIYFPKEMAPGLFSLNNATWISKEKVLEKQQRDWHKKVTSWRW